MEYPNRDTESSITLSGAMLPISSFLSVGISPIPSAISCRIKVDYSICEHAYRQKASFLSRKQTAAIVEGAKIVPRLIFSAAEHTLCLILLHVPSWPTYTKKHNLQSYKMLTREYQKTKRL